MGLKEFVDKYSRFIFVLSVVALLIIVLLFPYSNFSVFSSNSSQNSVDRGEVAVVDQFYSYDSNFSDEVTDLFGGEGVEVDVFENITVDLYRRLPTMGYKVIIFRVHSASGADLVNGSKIIGSPIYSTEEYESSKYPILQSKNFLVPAVAQDWYRDEEMRVFAVMPKFIATKTEGEFNNTLIVFDSCDVVKPENDYKLFQAFYEKGAGAVIGWKGLITINQGDEGTLKLMRNIVDGKKLGESVSQTNRYLINNTTHDAGLMLPGRSSDKKLVIKDSNIKLVEE